MAGCAPRVGLRAQSGFHWWARMQNTIDASALHAHRRATDAANGTSGGAAAAAWARRRDDEAARRPPQNTAQTAELQAAARAAHAPPPPRPTAFAVRAIGAGRPAFRGFRAHATAPEPVPEPEHEREPELGGATSATSATRYVAVVVRTGGVVVVVVERAREPGSLGA